MAISAKRIEETFSVSAFRANLALLVIRGRVDPENHPARFPRTADWIRQCYHAPSTSEIKLSALDELLQTYGVEPLRVPGVWVDRYHGDVVASYLNTGDTYRLTLLLDHESRRWKLTSWGDWLERYEAANPDLVEAWR